MPDNGTVQLSLSWHKLCVVVGRLLGEFVVSWLVGIFVDSLLMGDFVVWWLVFDSLLAGTIAGYTVSVSVSICALSGICADQWYPAVIPPNRDVQTLHLPGEVFFVQFFLEDSCKKTD